MVWVGVNYNNVKANDFDDNDYKNTFITLEVRLCWIIGNKRSIHIYGVQKYFSLLVEQF